MWVPDYDPDWPYPLRYQTSPNTRDTLCICCTYTGQQSTDIIVKILMQTRA